MAMKGSGGGGYGSRQHTEQSVRTGSGSHSATPAGVGQLGQKQGSHVTHGEESNYRGERLHNPERNFNTGVKFGNEIALNSKSAPGQGRDIHPAGGQGCHGQPAQGAAGPPSTRGQWPDSK